MKTSNKSKYYPYAKVQDSYLSLKETVDLPRLICDYLIDAPKGDYQPIDDNEYPRCRFWKYLYYDTAKPLNKPLPSIAEKMNVVFNADKPEEPPSELGYRLIPLVFTKQAQENAQTRVYIYMGRTISRDEGEFKVAIALNFKIYTNYSYETNTKGDGYSRCFAIEQALIEALHGVNIAGIGTISLSRKVHPDCGSVEMFDGISNVGRKLVMAIEIATTEGVEVDTDNEIYIEDGITLA